MEFSHPTCHGTYGTSSRMLFWVSEAYDYDSYGLSSWTTAYRRPWVLGGFGGFWGGLITFLAARLTRYSLGLAATLSTLLLHRTLAHAIKFFL